MKRPIVVAGLLLAVLATLVVVVADP